MLKLTKRDIVSILTRAKNYIKRHGWQQESYGRKASGPVCMIGACNAVTTNNPPGACLGRVSETPETREVRKFLKKEFKITDVEAWNDDKVKSRKEVFDLIDRAVAKLTE